MCKKRSCGIIFMRHLSDTVGGVNLFIVGRLETDSSKGTFMCRVWDCLQLRAVKTPDTFEEIDPKGSFFSVFEKTRSFFPKGDTLLLTL